MLSEYENILLAATKRLEECSAAIAEANAALVAATALIEKQADRIAVLEATVRRLTGLN